MEKVNHLDCVVDRRIGDARGRGNGRPFHDGTAMRTFRLG